jgi:hypothetical protein
VLSVDDLWKLELEQTKRERETTDPDPDMWRWSPLEIWKFAPMLEVAKADAVSSGLREFYFGEAGSGIGTKLYLAKHHFGMHETGYEISDEYLAQSRALGVRAEKCDLRTDVPPWEKFNFVYIARPFKDDGYEVEWERDLMRRMKDGAYLISAYAAVKPYTWRLLLRETYRGVWQKVRESPGNYTQMVQRCTTGSDALVPEPGPIR